MEGFVQSLIVVALLTLAELVIRDVWQRLRPLSR